MKRLFLIFFVNITILVFMGIPAMSKAPIDVVKEFVKAGNSADFKKLADLGCKNFGPYLKIEDAKEIDIGDLGFIQEIIREEKSEDDPKRLCIVIAKLNVLGKLAFGAFYVFKTGKGWKVYVSDGFLRKYPVKTMKVSRAMLNFYRSNKIYLDVAIKLAINNVNLNPKNVKAHLELAELYDLNGIKDKEIYEYIEVIRIDPTYAERTIDKDKLISSWNKMLTDNIMRYYAAERLWSSTKNEKAIPILIEMYSNKIVKARGSYEYKKTAHKLAAISWSNTAPLLIKDLDENANFKVSIAADLLGQKKEKQAVSSLIKALKYDKNKFKIIEGHGIDPSPYSEIAEALGKIGDENAVPALKENLGLAFRRYNVGSGKSYLKALTQLTGDDWNNYNFFFSGNFILERFLHKNKLIKWGANIEITEIQIKDCKNFSFIVKSKSYKKENTIPVNLRSEQDRWIVVN